MKEQLFDLLRQLEYDFTVEDNRCKFIYRNMQAEVNLECGFSIAAAIAILEKEVE